MKISFKATKEFATNYNEYENEKRKEAKAHKNFRQQRRARKHLWSDAA